MSQLEVNKIVPQTGTSLTYGDNGDTFQIPSGVTLDIASGGTIDATGATITGFDAASDEKVKISSNDTTPGFLNGKLTAGANITLTEGSDGGDETLSIALSGTIPDARFPATLPAASGVNLTALNASNLGSGTVPTARLGSGTASSSTFLAGDQTFKTITGTTINNNADNRLITGSGTANTLEGEANLTFDGTNLDLPDDKKIRFGTGNDLEIYHDSGTNKSYIKESGSADLVIAGNDILFRNTADDETMAYFQHDGAVTLKHNHVTKFATTSGGIDVTGAITVNGSALAGGATEVNVVTIESTGTYTPSSGCLFYKVYAQGAGGGGGGINPNGNTTAQGAAGNGGNCSIKFYDATEMGSTAAVTIGAGGSAGSGDNNGGTGGDTSFNPAGTGATVTGAGGYGGYKLNNDNSQGTPNYSHNTSTSGDITIFGQFPIIPPITLTNASSARFIGQYGGHSFLGRGSDVRSMTGSGDSDGYGGTRGGGGGGAISRSNSDAAGGAGGSGIVIVEEYK